MGTFNVNGINNPTKRRAIFKSLRDQGLDFCCIQETHSSPTTVHLWQSEWGGHFLASNGRQNARGVAILIKRSLQYKLLQQVSDDEGRILLVEVDIQGKIYTLGSLYTPTQDKPQEQLQFLNQLEEKLESFSDTNIILGGDFNSTLNQDLDRNQPPTKTGGPNQYRERIKALLEDNHLSDIWRLRNPSSRGYTFRRGSYASRLDYIFISDHLSETVSRTTITRESQSDHSLLIMECKQQRSSKGPGLWRFDASLLTNTTFTSQMSEFLEAWEAPPELLDPRVTWEWLKFQIKEFVIKYQAQNKSLRAKPSKTSAAGFKLYPISKTRRKETKNLSSLKSIQSDVN